jgi:nucleoside phosphorylase
MGLVDASITGARALEAFNPRLISMAGICAGFPGEAELGALIVSEISWEHQAGKWRGEDFEIREYQEPLDNDVRTALSQMIEQDRKLTKFASKPHEIAVPHVDARILPTVSGSAVIASTHYSEIIRKQHGKVAGVDMEIYGVHRAAALFGQHVMCFAAKTVVDHANEAKSNDLQQAGAILSARFVVQAIRILLGSEESGRKARSAKGGEPSC